MEESGDKLNATQLKEAQKQTTNINDTQFPKKKKKKKKKNTIPKKKKKKKKKKS